MRARTWARFLTVAIMCTGVDRVPHAQVVQAPAPARIEFPSSDSLLTGPVVLKAEASSSVKSVSFFVDGNLICLVEKAPFECPYDAGAAIAARLIRIVASLADGNRVVETVQTKSFQVAETTGTSAVLVPAVVTDWTGRFVQNLNEQSFRVLENGTPQTVTFVKAEQIPVDIVVAVDISGSMAPEMPKLKEAVKRLLSRLTTIDHVTVLAFNDRTYEVTRRDANPQTRASAIDTLRAFGGTSLYDAILQAVNHLGHEISRKAVVVFTDGDDRTSLAPLDPVEKHIRESDATVYMITQGKTAQVERIRKAVDRLSTLSGGRTFKIEKIDELEKALQTVMDDLTHQYLIGYSPTNPAHDGTYRKIEVTTATKSNEVRAREGYRSPSR